MSHWGGYTRPAAGLRAAAMAAEVDVVWLETALETL
jgi:hypothetical protein